MIKQVPLHVDVVSEVVIQRPVELVAAFAADPANATAWYENIVDARWVTQPPLSVGSQMAFEARFLGRMLVYTYSVTEYAPNQRLVMRTAEGPFPMETTYEWQSEGPGATRMRLRNRGRPSGFARWLTPIMRVAMRIANRRDLARLRTVLET